MKLARVGVLIDAGAFYAPMCAEPLGLPPIDAPGPATAERVERAERDAVADRGSMPLLLENEPGKPNEDAIDVLELDLASWIDQLEGLDHVLAMALHFGCGALAIGAGRLDPRRIRRGNERHCS